jgi:hypothetical protein
MHTGGNAMTNVPKKRWYREPSLVISMTALFITLVTTTTSAYRTYRQDVEARKAELRALVLQLNAQQLQTIELLAKHEKDSTLANISSTLVVQNMLTAKQAYTVVKALGRDATSVDYGYVSYVLSTVREMGLAEELGLIALERATNAVEYLGATRQLATLKMTLRQTAEAEIYFKKALTVFDLYPKDVINDINVHNMHAWTYLNWAASSVDCKMLLDHFAEANKEIDMLGTSAPLDTINYRDQFANRNVCGIAAHMPAGIQSNDISAANPLSPTRTPALR